MCRVLDSSPVRGDIAFFGFVWEIVGYYFLAPGQIPTQWMDRGNHYTLCVMWIFKDLHFAKFVRICEFYM